MRSFCRENVNHFFDNLAAVKDDFKEKMGYEFSEDRIWNMDETGFSTVQEDIGKVIAMKGTRRVGQMAPGERGQLVTMALAVNAMGNSVPPFYVFPQKNMQSAFLDFASPTTVGYANGSGWMQQEEYVLWLNHFIRFAKPSPDAPVLLLLDNHSSHLSVQAIDLANDNGIVMLSFPPHCSHRLQPLDVSVYGPLKTYYKSICADWQRSNTSKSFECKHIPLCVKQSLALALQQTNITSGFRATGIEPFNRHVFIDASSIFMSFSSNLGRGGEGICMDFPRGEDGNCITHTIALGCVCEHCVFTLHIYIARVNRVTKKKTFAK